EGDELGHLGHHLRSDAVTGEKKELVGRHCALPRLNASPLRLLKARALLGKLGSPFRGVALLMAGLRGGAVEGAWCERVQRSSSSAQASAASKRRRRSAAFPST